MGEADFEKWLLTIGRLDAAQRQRALRVLALAEAADTGGFLPPCGDDGTAGGRDAAVSPAQLDGGAGAESPFGKIGRLRLESFGCPHCSSAEVRPWGRAGDKLRYRCAACRKTFNPLTGTPLAGLHHQDRWRDQARALIAGETVAQAAKRCGVAYTTAFRWRHRFLAALNLDKPQRLSGIVEADETFILEGTSNYLTVVVV